VTAGRTLTAQQKNAVAPTLMPTPTMQCNYPHAAAGDKSNIVPPTPHPSRRPRRLVPRPLFPGVQFTFATEPAARLIRWWCTSSSFPRRSRLIWPPAAAQLGVDGEVVEYTGEGGWPIYEVHGEGSVVRFLG